MSTPTSIIVRGVRHVAVPPAKLEYSMPQCLSEFPYLSAFHFSAPPESYLRPMLVPVYAMETPLSYQNSCELSAALMSAAAAELYPDGCN